MSKSSFVPDSVDNLLLMARVQQFMALESALLDNNNLGEWYDLLDSEFLYLIPIRVVRERRHNADFPANSYHQRDTKGSVKIRIDRLKTGHAWAEDPPTRIVRSVGNPLIESVNGDVVSVSSAILLYREHPQVLHADLIGARREDKLRVRGDKITLLERVVYLAQTTITTPNLGMFF